jgi:hypothetical protein
MALAINLTHTRGCAARWAASRFRAGDAALGLNSPLHGYCGKARVDPCSNELIVDEDEENE